MDRLTSMQLFVQTVSEGSFSAAARVLGLSPTMVAKHLQALEDRLGVRLLHRSTRRLTLTAEGAVYRERCQHVLNEIDEIEAGIGSERLTPRGVLRVNVSVSFGIRHLAPLLPAYARLYPDVTVEVGLSNGYVDLIDEGWDGVLRIGPLADSTLMARRLAVCGMAVCAAPAYLAARGTPATVGALAGHNCLGYMASSKVAQPWLFQGPYGEMAFQPSGTLRASEGEVLHAAALGGHGIVCEPTFVAGDDLNAGRLIALALDQVPLGRPLHALWSPGRQLSAKIRSLTKFLAEQYGSQPP